MYTSIRLSNSSMFKPNRPSCTSILSVAFMISNGLLTLVPDSQRASETAQNINSLASSSLASAQTRVHTLSENMLSELQKLQTQTTTLSTSIQSSIQTSKSQLQTQLGPQIQQTYSEISAILSTSIADLNDILKKKETPLPEKVGLVGKEVRERVTPLLDVIKKGVTEILARGKEIAQNGSSEPSSPVSEEPPVVKKEDFPPLPSQIEEKDAAKVEKPVEAEKSA